MIVIGSRILPQHNKRARRAKCEVQDHHVRRPGKGRAEFGGRWNRWREDGSEIVCELT